MDWKQQITLILMGAFVSSMLFGFLLEIVEDKISNEYFGSFEYQRRIFEEM